MNSNRANASARSDEIKKRVLELGFSKVGIARDDNLAHEYSRLQEWLRHGYHGEMKWMEREPELRTDPRLVFPAARSVVVVALNYYTPHQHQVSTTCVSGSSVSTG